MESFWEFAKIALIVGAALALVVLILLILPGSRLRKAFSTLFFCNCWVIRSLCREPNGLHPRHNSPFGPK